MDVREIRLRLEMLVRDNEPKPHAILLTRDQMKSLKEDLLHSENDDPFNDVIELFGIRVLTEDKILRI